MPEVPEVPVPQPTADADAAASAPKEPIRLRDLGRDLLRPSLSHLVFAVVLALVAFGATVVVQSQSRDDSYENLRRTDLIALLDDLLWPPTQVAAAGSQATATWHPDALRWV